MSELAVLKQNAFNSNRTTKFLSTLDRDQITTLYWEIEAEFYWHKRTPPWKDLTSKKILSWLNKVARNIKKRLSTGRVRIPMSSNGSAMESVSLGLLDGPDEYEWRCLKQTGWLCMWNNGYSAAWVNVDILALHAYTEGDVTRLISPTNDVFELEVAEYCQFALDQGYSVMYPRL